MSFAALPLLYLTWDASTVALADFIRYQVYRRVLGATDWSKVARINDRAVTFYQDFNVAAGVEYEYAVTQVKDVSGEEVESAFPTGVSAAVTLVSSFLHDVAGPVNYAEFDVNQQLEIGQSVGFVQPWSRQVPTMHVGNVETKALSLRIGPLHWDTESGTWDALVSLQSRQRTSGSLLCYRDQRGSRVFCQLTQLGKGEAEVRADINVGLREVYYREEVD
jgi:hypothetical protein